MATMNDIRHRDRKRVAILNNVKLAGRAGLVLDESYVARPELESMVRAGLLVEMPGGQRRHQLTKKGESLLKRQERTKR